MSRRSQTGTSGSCVDINKTRLLHRLVKWRNQLLALFCLIVFLAFGVIYFRYWVVQKPFGIILFIGEGLGPGRLAMTRVFAGGVDKPLAIDSLTYTALLRNYSNDFAAPDEAAAATALATGVKVNNGSIGIDVEGKTLKNLMELARASGRMTGLVTNARLTDATPASFYAHVSSKDDRARLARDLVEKGKLDLVLGGNAEDFLPISKGGSRNDDRDLVAQLQDAGYDVVRSREELDEIPRWRQAKLFGLFGDSEGKGVDAENVPSDQPTLADMVRRGIELLQFNSGGYLLVVDAGLMRKAARENDIPRTLSETVELDRAVAVALEYAGTASTIFVTGDVAIGGLTLNGSPPRHLSGDALLTNGAGDFSLTWATGPTGPQPNETLSADPTPAPTADEVIGPPAVPVSHPAAIYAKSAQETTDDVVSFGIGLGADALHGTLESTAVFEVIRDNL
jgi:alkaline phosphatase